MVDNDFTNDDAAATAAVDDDEAAFVISDNGWQKVYIFR